MGIGKQAKVLTKNQIDIIAEYLPSHRNGKRNLVIFLLSTKAGMRAKEIACLKWNMLLTSDGTLGEEIHLSNDASKGSTGGRVIPMNKQLRQALVQLFQEEVENNPLFDTHKAFVIRTERQSSTTAQAIVNQFRVWYKIFGLLGCSSHSGRRTFITNTARKISTVGGSLKDIQMLAGHSSLQTTQRYIDENKDAKKRVVDLV